MTEQTDPNAAPAAENPPTPALATVPDHIIPAELPHPNTQGGVLSRGVRYLHHFEVELVSDGKRLWAVVSEEGKAVLAAITGEKQTEEDQIEAHKTRLATAAAEEKAAAEEAAKSPPTIVLDPDGKPVSGGAPGLQA